MFSSAVSGRHALNVVVIRQLGDDVVDLSGGGKQEMHAADDLVHVASASLPGQVREDVFNSGMRTADNHNGAAGRVEDERNFGQVAKTGSLRQRTQQMNPG